MSHGQTGSWFSVGENRALHELVVYRAPVGAQSEQQLRTQGNFAIDISFAVLNAYHHALAVDVGHLEMDQFATPQACRIQGFQQRTMIEVLGGINELCHLIGTEHVGETSPMLRIRKVLFHVVTLEDLEIEEAQCGDAVYDCLWSELPVFQQMHLVVADIVGSKVIKSLPGVTSKLVQDSQVSPNRTGGVVAAHEFFSRTQDQCGHRDTSLLCNQTYSSHHQQSRGIRRASGFVLVGSSEVVLKRSWRKLGHLSSKPT
jgi:hypothetical protein